MIYICNFHVLSHLLLIYICKLHWCVPMPGEKIIRSLPTFKSMSWELKPGDFAQA